MFSLNFKQLYNRSTLFELKILMLLNVSQKHQMISVPKRDQDSSRDYRAMASGKSESKRITETWTVEHHDILSIKDVIHEPKALALVTHSLISLLRLLCAAVVQKSMLKHNLFFRFTNYAADARLSTEISIACECCSRYTLLLCRHKYEYSQETTLFREYVHLSNDDMLMCLLCVLAWFITSRDFAATQQ